MKSFFTALLLSISGLAFGQAVEAQGVPTRAWQTHTHALTLQEGFGWRAIENSAIRTQSVDGVSGYVSNYEKTTTPAGPSTTLAYDYRVGRIFSIGAAVGHQAQRQELLRESGFDGALETLRGTAKVNRFFFSGRTLFHYGLGKNFEFYSGLRFGVIRRTVSTTGDFADAEVRTELGLGEDRLRPQVTLIPFGFKAYVGNHVYLGAETMFGTPHVVAAQLGYRF